MELFGNPEKTSPLTCYILQRFVKRKKTNPHMLEPPILTEPTNMDRAFVYLVSMSVIFSSPELKTPGELIEWDSSRCPSVGPSVHIFKYEYL